MRNVNGIETQMISGCGLGSAMIEIFTGPIPWGLGHAMQSIDGPTLACGFALGSLVTANFSSMYYNSQVNTQLRLQNQRLLQILERGQAPVHVARAIL